MDVMERYREKVLALREEALVAWSSYWRERWMLEGDRARLYVALAEMAVRCWARTLTPERELELWDVIFSSEWRGVQWV